MTRYPRFCLVALFCSIARSLAFSKASSVTRRRPLGPCHSTTTTTTTTIAKTTTTTATTTTTTTIIATTTTLYAVSSPKKCTPLPSGLSPFEKSSTSQESLDLQGTFRTLAATALRQALRDDDCPRLLQVEFPPLLGGEKAKTQFDDFDNVQELNANRDWCVQLVPSLSTKGGKGDCWLILPDDKEVELAKAEWKGQRYRSACKFTSIRAAVQAAGAPLKLAWGSTFASALNKLQGGDGILADSDALDTLDASTVALHIVCQPGNGGPVEDWINVETLSKSLPNVPLVVVNGALDKVIGGFYPAVFFPALAATKPYYDAFESAFFLKPLSDKSLYGWLYRVYPEPWQVVLQRPKTVQRGSQSVVTVENIVALVSETRPTYQEAVQAMLKAAASS